MAEDTGTDQHDDATDDEEVDDPGTEGDDLDEADEKDDEALGDAGKKALVAERAKVKELRNQLREQMRKAQGEGDTEDAEAKAAAKWKPKVTNSAARAALLEAGGTNVTALLKMVDHDELDVTDDGQVDGLDAEVDRLREEVPELFARTTRRAGRRVETGDRSGSTAPKLSASERQARQIMGKG